MSDELVVNVPAVENSAARVGLVARSIADLSIQDYTDAGMGPTDVQAAVGQFVDEWIWPIGGLVDAIASLYVSAGDAVLAYEDLDRELALPAHQGLVR